MKIYKVIITLIVIVLSGACSRNSGYLIDNPGENPMEVSIDNGKAFALEPGESKRIELKKGEHTLTINNGEAQTFYVKDSISSYTGGLLNPARATYVMWTEVYAEEGKSSHLPVKRIHIDDYWFEGPYETFDELFIPTIWEYDINTGFPETVLLKNNASAIWKRKLFRKKDFLEEFTRRYPDNGLPSKQGKQISR